MFHFPRPSSFVALINSRLRPLDIEDGVIREVLRSYGLSMAGKPLNLALSRRTGNVVIPTNAGRLVLKRYRDHLQTDGIRYIHSIITRLSELSLPSLKLIHAPSGLNFILLKSGRYALFEFIAGSNYSLDYILPSDLRKLIKTSGCILASFHQSLNGFQPSGAHHLGFTSYTGGWQRDVEWFANKVHELTEKSSTISNPEDGNIAEFLISHVEETFDEFCRLDERLRKAHLLRTIIHGDFGLHNLVFQKNGRAVLTDYETARLEWRLADLVLTLSRYRSQDTMYHFRSIKNFLSGYQSVYPVPEEEWQYLPDMWRFVKLRSVFINWNSHFERGGGKLSSALDAYHQAGWVWDHAEALLKLRDQ